MFVRNSGTRSNLDCARRAPTGPFRSAVRFVARAGALLLLVTCCCVSPQAAAAADKNDAAFLKKMYTTKQGAQMPYRLFLPQGYDSRQKYPLVLWLHGAMGRGFDNVAQISGGNELGSHVWTAPENQARMPAFVLAPQCPDREYWSEPELNQITPQLQMALDILAIVQKEYSIDPGRIYIAGQSMGGLGVWALAQAFPEKWAAAVVLCAYDNLTNVQGLGRVPVWVFQGDADDTVPVELVRKMMKDLKKAGVTPRYTEYHKAGHDVWLKAFAEPELVPWVAAQKRGN